MILATAGNVLRPRSVIAHRALAGIAVALLSAASCAGVDDGDVSGFTGEASDAADASEPGDDDDDGDSGSATASTTTPSTTHDPSGAQPSTDPTDESVSASAAGESDDGAADTSGDEGAASEDSTGDAPDDTGDQLPGRPSPGCGVTQFEPGTLLAVPVQVGAQQRTFNVVIPNAHDGETPVSVVLAFHGWGLNPTTMAQMSDLSDTAAQHGFVVAYSQGLGNSWNAGSCCGVAFDQEVDDVAFVRALIDNIGENLCVDLDRVYATGFSNGGMLSHRLACEASDVIAAIAPVAGVLMLEDAECTPSRPMPILHFHGTGDTSVGYYGDGMVDHVSVAVSTDSWVDRNGCDPQPEITLMDDDTTCETWSNCGDDGVVVTLCSIEGMGHCWPGDPACIGGNGDGVASTTINASEAIATFFAGYTLP